jgi:metallo-beta-lactamase family protein
MIKMNFFGAVEEVTGSRHLIEAQGQRILLDCGLYQGRRKETYERNLNFPFDPSSIDTLIVSHSHIDHIGNIPNLVKQGFSGNIHCTLATADLMNIMLMDSAHIQENDVAYVNKIRARHNEPPIEPLYTQEDIPPVIELIEAHGYNHSFKLDGVKAIFRDAGHIIGSAITVLDINDDGRQVSICFTGDLGRHNLPIIRDPYVVDNADILIIESTYGNREHENIKGAAERFARIVNETVNRGGKIIIPAFALERTQELIYTINNLKNEHRIPDIPVYVDSPLAINATEIFRAHPECFDKKVNDILQYDDDPFGFDNLYFTRKVEDSKAINENRHPMIIISASGMAENGRILHHLKNNIENPANTIMIVGWQAHNTLGRKIAERLPEVPIFGEKYKLNSQVEMFDEFSAHADRNDLIEWVAKGKDRWKKVFIVHGESEASSALQKSLQEIGIKDVIIPDLGRSYHV